VITVKDYGMGIPEDKLNNLFLNFSKIEENAAANKNGVGLGLSICKDLIEQMGGSVTVQSKQNKFTKFLIKMNTTC
jgi:K+-sensing histidine kinase KdpD